MGADLAPRSNIIRVGSAGSVSQCICSLHLQNAGQACSWAKSRRLQRVHFAFCRAKANQSHCASARHGCQYRKMLLPEKAAGIRASVAAVLRESCLVSLEAGWERTAAFCTHSTRPKRDFHGVTSLHPPILPKLSVFWGGSEQPVGRQAAPGCLQWNMHALHGAFGWLSCKWHP